MNIHNFIRNLPQKYMNNRLRPMFYWNDCLRKGRNLKGIEIGVREGKHAKILLKNLDIEELFLIDPYLEYECHNSVYEQKFLTDAKKISRDRLSAYEDKIHWYYVSSDNALNHFENDYFDFVYIDGCHTYEQVSKDIMNYYSLVKKGGIIGGDDFRANYSGLCMAVLDFVNAYDFKLNGKFNDWWIEIL